MSEQVLIAGCGDVGLRVAGMLRARGDRVVALRRSVPAQSDPWIEWIAGDLTRPHTLSNLPETITQLIYLPTPARRDELAYREIFVDGLRHVMQALRSSSLRRVLLVSSSAVYGEHDGAWVDEDTLPSPLGFNGRVLLEAEQWLAAQATPSIVLRLAGLYGPGRSQLFEQLQAGKSHASQTHWANRMHVDDAAAAIVHLLNLETPQSLYLGVDDTPLRLSDLYGHIAALLGAPSVPDGAAPSGIGSKRLSNARLRATGFQLRWPDAREGYRALLEHEY
jgi:nucleoside-diphosphate-sugar epimerase